MDDVIFSNSFRFRVFRHANDRITDNRHGIRSHYFALLESGSCRICTDGSTVQIAEGDIFYLPNGLRYQSFWHGEPEVCFISLGFGFLPNFDSRSYGPQVIEGCERSRELFRSIAAYKEPDAVSVGLFYTLAGILLPRMTYATADNRSRLVDFAKDYILRHPDASASEIARAAAVSESSLYLAFQKSSGETIREFRNSVRMDEARRILISSDISVEDISELLHFSSASYFRKCFKSYFGVSPRQMRNKCDI